MTFRRSMSLLLAAMALLATAAATPNVLPQLVRHAHAIGTDLSPLGGMVGDAVVVGAGEASHGAAEFAVTKHRAFRYLVQHKGFRTFSLEVGWSAGLRLNRYVLTGQGDPRQIMREEFQANYEIWYTREYLELIEWMRSYNAGHPDKLEFAGHDMAYSGPEQFDLVTRYVAAHRPDLVDGLAARYDGLRPTVQIGAWFGEYRGRPLADRQAAAVQAREALELVSGIADPSSEHAWAVQHATVIAQTFQMWSGDLTEAFRYRERATADNVLWWRRHTGHRILLSAANFHVAHESYAAGFPRVQGTYLREELGDRYVSLGFTFGRGAVHARESDGAPLLPVRVPPAPAGNNEHLLERVSAADFLLDTRGVPAEARDWLVQSRPTRSFGEFYPEPDAVVALGRSYDLIVHLHRVRPSSLLGGSVWTTTWAASPQRPGRSYTPNWSEQGFADQTVRQVVRLSAGGNLVRLRLSNAFGTSPLRIAGATVARSGGDGAAIRPESLRHLTVNGSRAFAIPAGGQLATDPTPLAVSTLDLITITLYLAEPTGPATYHAQAMATAYRSAGDHHADPDGTAFTETSMSWYYLSGVDVFGWTPCRTGVAAFGDSLTDGFGSTFGANNRYPDELAERLAAVDKPRAVVNQGIGGNRVTIDSAWLGDSATSRFRRDVLGQPGVGTVIILMGINDIGMSETTAPPLNAPFTEASAEQIIAGHRDLIGQARGAGIRVIGATLLPMKGSRYYTERSEPKRDAVNAWIRTSGEYDAVIDLDRALAAPSDEDQLDPAYDSGDHLHLNDAGYRAVAEAVDPADFACSVTTMEGTK